MVAALVPENVADGDVDKRGRYERRNRKDLEGVSQGPKSEKDGGADGGLEPEIRVRVELRAKEEADCGETEERVIQGAKDDAGADPGGQRGAEIVKGVEDPADGPIEEIVLALEGIDVGEEHSDKERSEKQAERDYAL